MKVFSLEIIIDFLNQNAIEFKVLEGKNNSNDEFSFASIKNIIKNGIYYFEDIDVIKNFNIENSVLICNNHYETTNNLIIVANPQIVHYKLCSLAAEPKVYSIATSTKISSKAKIASNVSIGENCVIGDCIIEEGVVLKHNVVIEDNVTLKKNSFIDSNSVIGAGGLAWIWDENGERVIQPQLGGVIIEENCSLATDITVVKGSLSENTLIGKGTVIAHGTKIGHGAQIMSEVHMANNVSIAGNAVIGDRCFLGSACVISSNVKVAANCIIGAGAVVNKSNLEEFCTLAGVPAKIIKKNNFNSKPNGAPKPFLNLTK
jgi:UDP-3-O-[3-hydroxymyristoyl] glucosamine N-acyltransferase